MESLPLAIRHDGASIYTCGRDMSHCYAHSNLICAGWDVPHRSQNASIRRSVRRVAASTMEWQVVFVQQSACIVLFVSASIGHSILTGFCTFAPKSGKVSQKNALMYTCSPIFLLARCARAHLSPRSQKQTPKA